MRLVSSPIGGPRHSSCDPILPGARIGAASTVAFALLVSFLALVWSAPQSAAQSLSEYCAEGATSSVASGIAAQDTVYALVIYARFSDAGEDGPPPGCPDPWPRTATTAPPLSVGIIDSAYPSTDGSLTHYFELMSRNDENSSPVHSLFGEVYPSVVNLGTMGSVAAAYPGADFQAAACASAILAADSDGSFDLGDPRFDANGDGEMDFVFVCFRDQFAPSGPGAIFIPGYSGESNLGTGTPFPLTVGNSGTLTVPDQNGATVTVRPVDRSRRMYRFIMAHEYVHDLMDLFPHGIDGRGGHLSSMGPYALMDGTSSASGKGGELVSSFVRSGLGWIAPQVSVDLSVWSPGQSLDIEMRDAGKYGADGFVRVDTPSPAQSFLLECRDSLATSFSSEDGCRGAEAYSGLLAVHWSREWREPCGPGPIPSDVDSWWDYEVIDQDLFHREWPCDPPTCDCNPIEGGCVNERYPPNLDPEMASGMMDTLSWAPDPVSGWDGSSFNDHFARGQTENDLFGEGPSRTNVFAPYTDPSTNLYYAPPPQSNPDYDHVSHCEFRQTQPDYSGLSVYNIRWEGTPGTAGRKLKCTIRYDGPTEPSGPIPVADGTRWTGELVIATDIEVPAGATLTIAEGTKVRFASSDYRGTGRFDDKIEMVINGTVVFEGTAPGSVVLTSSRDGEVLSFPGEYETPGPGTQDWGGLTMGATGVLDTEVGASAGAVEVRYAQQGVAYDVGQWPDLTGDGVGRFEFLSCDVDVAFLNQDVEVPSSTTAVVPAGWTIGFSDDDVADGGVDLERIELIVNGTLDLSAAGSTLQSAKISSAPAAGDWYGVRTDAPDIDLLLPSSGTVSIRHASAAVADESPNLSDWPDLIALDQNVEFSDNVADVGFDRDRLIDDGAAVTVPAGFKVGFLANGQSASSTFGESTLCELLVKGRLVAEGSVGSEVLFGSFGGAGLAGEWRGMRFDLEGVETAYGFAAAGPYSSLRDAKVENAEVGVEVHNLIPPSIQNVSFINVDDASGVNKHVFLDSVDVAIPWGYIDNIVAGNPPDTVYASTPMEWALEAPTIVVAGDSATVDRTYVPGNATKVDLFVDGVLRTGDTEGTDFVEFRPLTRVNATADGWGGIRVAPDALVHLSRADVGHASTLVYFQNPDSCIVEDSSLHHYATQGVHVVGSNDGPGVRVEGCSIVRGAGIGGTLGLWGINATGVYSLRVLNNEVYDKADSQSSDPPPGGGGVAVVGGKTHCASSGGYADSILVKGNSIVGPSEDFDGERTGISLFWACGESSRPFVVEGNAMIQWKTGVRLDECRELTLSCNLMKDNDVGLNWYRMPSLDPDVALRENQMEGNATAGLTSVADIDALGLGAPDPLPADRGRNRCVRQEGSSYYVAQGSPTGTLNAQNNQWRDESAVPPVNESSQGDVWLKSLGNTSAIAATPLIGGAIAVCWPAEPPLYPGGVGSTAAPGPALQQVATAGEDPQQFESSGQGEDSIRSLSGLPSASQFRQVRPNPSSENVAIALGVAAPDAGDGAVAIYNLRGQRVKQLYSGKLDAGWTTFEWDGRASDGIRVAAGVYFVHARLPVSRFTTKLVRLQP